MNMNVRHTIVRNGTYYLNVRIPPHLQELFKGKKHIVKSLKTKNPDEATIKALKLYREAQDTFKQLTDSASGSSGSGGFSNILLDLNGIGQVNIDTGSSTEDSRVAKELLESVGGSNVQANASVPSNKYMLSEAIRHYIARKTPDWGDKTLGQNENILSLLLEILGDKDVKEIKPADADKFRQVIIKLPANISKHRKKGLSLQDILALNEKPRSVATSNRQFITVGSFFRWLVLRDDIVKSYFEKMTSKKGVRPADERNVYTDQELVLAFSTLKEDVFNSHILSEHNYWIPLICLYSGMRVGEVAQLLISDVDTSNRTIEISAGDGKQVKSLAANRVIPIHSQLINLGLLDYIRSVKHMRLFPKLSKGADGYGHNVSRWWSNRGKQLGYPSIHSLRHTFITKMKYAKVNDYIVAEIVGHSMNSITFSRYGKGFELAELSKAVEEVKYSLHSK